MARFLGRFFVVYLDGSFGLGRFSFSSIVLVFCFVDESSAGFLSLVSAFFFIFLTAVEMAFYVKRFFRGRTVEGESVISFFGLGWFRRGGRVLFCRRGILVFVGVLVV